MTQAASSSDLQAGEFPVPFSLEEFRHSILEAYRMFAFLTWTVTGSREKAQGTFDLPPEVAREMENIFEPDYSTKQLDIPYDSIRHTPFASRLEELYELAFKGIARRGSHFEEGLDFTWVGAAVLLLVDSVFIEVWSMSGGISGEEGIRRCLKVIDIANARCALEFGTGFIHRDLGDGVAVGGALFDDDGLTINQMVLLSGMAEVTIRAAANPKRANRLETKSTSKGTRIDRAAAREWLISKGRYLPVKFDVVSRLDLPNTRFVSPRELASALESKAETEIAAGKHKLSALIKKLGRQHGFEENVLLPLLPFVTSVMDGESPLRELAELIDVPADLLVLRAKEACLLRSLTDVQTDIKQTALHNP